MQSCRTMKNTLDNSVHVILHSVSDRSYMRKQLSKMQQKSSQDKLNKEMLGLNTCIVNTWDIQPCRLWWEGTKAIKTSSNRISAQHSKPSQLEQKVITCLIPSYSPKIRGLFLILGQWVETGKSFFEHPRQPDRHPELLVYRTNIVEDYTDSYYIITTYSCSRLFGPMICKSKDIPLYKDYRIHEQIQKTY